MAAKLIRGAEVRRIISTVEAGLYGVLVQGLTDRDAKLAQIWAVTALVDGPVDSLLARRSSAAESKEGQQ